MRLKGEAFVEHGRAEVAVFFADVGHGAVQRSLFKAVGAAEVEQGFQPSFQHGGAVAADVAILSEQRVIFFCPMVDFEHALIML